MKNCPRGFGGGSAIDECWAEGALLSRESNGSTCSRITENCDWEDEGRGARKRVRDRGT